MWVRLDDQFHSHPKLASLGSMLLPCVGLHALALSWCGCHLTDGRLPREQVARLAGDVSGLLAEGHPWELVARLVNAGMWEQSDPDFVIHDYLEYNPSRRRVLQMLKTKALAGQAGGKASAQSRAQARAQAKFKRNSTPSPSPSPSPETSDVEHPRSTESPPSAADGFSDWPEEWQELSEYLATEQPFARLAPGLTKLAWWRAEDARLEGTGLFLLPLLRDCVRYWLVKGYTPRTAAGLRTKVTNAITYHLEASENAKAKGRPYHLER